MTDGVRPFVKSSNPDDCLLSRHTRLAGRYHRDGLLLVAIGRLIDDETDPQVALNHVAA